MRCRRMMQPRLKGLARTFGQTDELRYGLHAYRALAILTLQFLAAAPFRSFDAVNGLGAT